jgi:hypothetical protein
VQEALQFGIGLSTLIGSLYRVATKLAFPPDEVKGRVYSTLTWRRGFKYVKCRGG